MKIYAIIHYYDNGFTYEDYRNYVTTNLYSDLSKASKIYQSKTSGKYEGALELVEWELDTNNKKTLQETEYILAHRTTLGKKKKIKKIVMGTRVGNISNNIKL